MKLSGLVVKTDIETYTAKTGQEVTMYKFWLQSGDPLEGATEFSIDEAGFKKVKKGDQIQFIPSFVIRSRYGNQIVAGRVVDGLEVIKA
jgi:hypothetical protein